VTARTPSKAGTCNDRLTGTPATAVMPSTLGTTITVSVTEGKSARAGTSATEQIKNAFFV
jgi:hypothetical protein